MNYAIVIGIDHYSENPLKGAVADAIAFSKFLTQKKLVSENQHLKLITSEAHNSVALGPEIDMAIEEIVIDARKRNDKENRLYFYFSGHGIGNTFFNTALCLRLWSSKYVNHCISCLNYNVGIINKGIFNEILIFLDCCREHDALIGGSSPTFDWENKVGELTPKLFICNSTIYGKLSFEVGSDQKIGSDQKRGAFTTFLIHALNGDADKYNTGKISAFDLKKHIDNNFESYAYQNGKYQKASIWPIDMDDDIIICNIEDKIELYNFEITFRRNSNVTLLGRDTKEIKTEDVTEGQKWTLNLEKGFSILVDNKTMEKKLIENYSEKTVSHVEF